MFCLPFSFLPRILHNILILAINPVARAYKMTDIVNISSEINLYNEKWKITQNCIKVEKECHKEIIRIRQDFFFFFFIETQSSAAGMLWDILRKLLVS